MRIQPHLAHNGLLGQVAGGARRRRTTGQRLPIEAAPPPPSLFQVSPVLPSDARLRIPSIRIEEEGRTEEGGGTAQATKGVTRRRPFN